MRLIDGGEAFGSLSRRFHCGEVDALADVVRHFAQRVARAQDEGGGSVKTPPSLQTRMTGRPMRVSLHSLQHWVYEVLRWPSRRCPSR